MQPQDSAPTRVALYCRVSTEDQAQRDTVDGQLDFLRKYADLYGLTIAGEYVDDGWSGTIPLADRPEGRRLLDDARAGCFESVFVYRITRLARSLRALMDANSVLEAAGITIRSATEPFDTGTPIGRFLFQLLGSLSELDRATITENMALGRDRVARLGKWTNGPVPFGYDVDGDGRLTPSERIIPGLDMTEAAVARSVFVNIAGGSTTVAECRRLNALNVPTARRYASGTTVTVGEHWAPNRINLMVRSRVYAGTHTLKSKAGPIERTVPPLVDQATWDAAQAQLTRNRALSTRNAKRVYLLRGLIVCGSCGLRYAGTPNRSGTSPDWVGHYYRCGSQLGAMQPDPALRCRSKRLPADWIEATVWQDCAAFIRNPGTTLADAQRQLRERLAQTTHLDAERQRLVAALQEKDAERERVMTLFRRGKATLDEVEGQIDAINQEKAQLRAMLDGLAAQAEIARTWENRVGDAMLMLHRLGERLDDIEARDDRVEKQRIIAALVQEIRVVSEGTGRDKTAAITVRYTFGDARAVASTMGTPSANNCAITLDREIMAASGRIAVAAD